MLPQVSRTFALCIRFLPDDVREPVLLSYLLCRIADTVEDAPSLDPELKRALLDTFARAIAEPEVDLGPLAVAMGRREDADAVLTRRAATVVGELRRQQPAVQAAVARWVGEMCSGMAEYAARPAWSGDQGQSLRGLATVAELDRYCYHVAGTVGHLLTAVFTALRPRIAPATSARMDALAEDFGGGLQLVNILADVSRDWQRGVCYVPATVCREAGIEAAQLLDPDVRPQARAALAPLFELARRRLERARQYCLLVPRAEYQIRLFCLIPYYLALRTLRALEQDPHYPAPDQRVKIGRSAVYRTVTAARLCAASNRLLRAYAWRLEELAI